MKKWKILAFGFGVRNNRRARDLLLQEWEELSVNSRIVFIEEDDSTNTTQIVDADLIIIMKSYLPSELLKLARKLKGIVKFGVGVDRIDVDYASSKGIIVANTPSGLTQSSAEATLTMILALAKGLIDKIELCKRGIFPHVKHRGIELAGKTVGIIGLGRIGSRVAELCRFIGMKTIAYDPHLNSSRNKEGVELVSLKSLLRESDFISIHCPLTRETWHLIDEKELLLMKPTAFLINLSRGAIVNEKALFKALKEKRLAGAGLDVWEKEPVKPSNPLVNLPNVIATPHYLCLTWEAFVKNAELAKVAAQKIFSNERPDNVVNPIIFEH